MNGARIAPNLSVAVAAFPAGTPPPAAAGSQAPAGRWRRFVAAIPLRTALAATAAVWTFGCVWSFREQALFAQAKGFHNPWLLPAVIDGLAIALACVAYAASLDGRPGVVARLGTAVAVAASAVSNATFAGQRTGGDTAAVVIAAGVPVAANLAFEVLLHELRRQVMRRRGLPAPAAVPYPRLIRVVLAPWSTLAEWRRLVLDLTALRPAFTVGVATRTPPDATRDAVTLAAPTVAVTAPASSVSDTVSASDTPAGVAADPSAPADGPDTCTPSGATHARAGAPAAPAATSDPAPADASLSQATTTGMRHFGSSRLHQMIQTGARQGNRADAESDATMLSRSGDTGSLAEEARQFYRASVAANQPLTGRQLGQMYARSPSWGRERIAEAKSQDRQTRRDAADLTAESTSHGPTHGVHRSLTPVTEPSQ